MNKEDNYHVPVMMQACIEGLAIHPNGTYVDVTFGGGGHSSGIMQALDRGHLLVFDQDPDAVGNADTLVKSGSSSFTFIEANFRYLKKFLRLYGVNQVDGILADLGVSSHQIDEPGRGFSTRSDGDPDMRMDKTGKLTASRIINEYEERDLIHVLSAYGEVKNARTLASKLVNARSESPLRSISKLKHLAVELAPRGRENKYLAQVFQALRIEVNDELSALKELLVQSGEVLKRAGRLVVISYHSLEDRLVKSYINKGNFKGMDEKDFYGNPVRVFDPAHRKPIVATPEEIEKNSRARSAKLRIGIKR